MEISRQLSDNVIALALLLCMGALQVWCQLCPGPCQCPSPVPLCPAGVPLVLDGCQCCQVCARQQGEACSDLYVCDSQRGLQCDYSTSFPGDPGECSNQEELGCEMNGVSYLDGQVFHPSCATQCSCLGGGVTCVPLCPEDIRLPSPDCPHPQRVQLPGKCCKEWVCENMDNTILQDAITASRSDRLWPGMSGPQQNPAFNCIDQSTEWSVCSQTCDAGVSTRVSNKNPACRLEMQSRLCKVWPCQALQPRRSTMTHYRITHPTNGVSRIRRPPCGGRGAHPAARDHVATSGHRHGSRVADDGSMGEKEVFQRLHQPHYSRSHCPPLLHPVPEGFGSCSRGSMMGRLPDARGSYSSWNSTWRPSTRLLRDVRACPPSSPASQAKPWSGPTPYGVKETRPLRPLRQQGY
uniref:Cellular communication network factor 5 n=1 Tax=Hucho hucho TaxID=62062 RepID=A0A4W5QVZ1_9TELE